MFRNYWLISLRVLARQRLQTAVNLLGLAIGISTCLFIFLYLTHERAFDRHWQGYDRIYRLTTTFDLGGNTDRFALSNAAQVPSLLQHVPEVETATRLYPLAEQWVWISENDVRKQDKVFFTDSTFFSVFNYPILAGDALRALTRPKTAAISARAAEKLFGSQEVMGKPLKLARNTYEITAVFDNTQNPVHQDVDLLLSLNSAPPAFLQNITSDFFLMNCLSYVKLKPAVGQEQFVAQLRNWKEKIIRPFMAQNQVNGDVTYAAQPVADIHFDTSYIYEQASVTNRMYLYVFAILGVFVLVIACINYMNLSSARSLARVREIGIRKVLGAQQRQLVIQFFSESLLLTLLAFLLALGLAEALMGPFQALTGVDVRRVAQNGLLSTEVLGTGIALVLLIAASGAVYPALLLARLEPLQAVKSGGMQPVRAVTGWRAWLTANARRGLMLLQFIIAAALIAGTLVVGGQLWFMRNHDLGFDNRRVMAIDLPVADTTLMRDLRTVKQTFQDLPEVEAVSVAGHVPGRNTGRIIFTFPDEPERHEEVINIAFVDFDYLKLMGIQPIQGRGFDSTMPTDSTAFVINQAAAHFLGWPDPVGHRLATGLGPPGRIIGVVPDYHYAGLQKQIEPLALLIGPQPSGSFLVRVREGADFQQAVQQVENTWRGIERRFPLEYSFLETLHEKQYQHEDRTLTLLVYFAGTTVLICCMGVLGLAAFAARRRTKELGIRRIMGAGTSRLVALLTGEFFLVAALACALALPVVYILAGHWLESFAYPMPLGPGPFLVALALVLMVVAATVAGLALRTAWRNPVEALRHE